MPLTLKPLSLNYQAVHNDGQRHIMWQNGEYSILGFMGEHNRISYTVRKGETDQICTYNYANLQPCLDALVFEKRFGITTPAKKITDAIKLLQRVMGHNQSLILHGNTDLVTYGTYTLRREDAAEMMIELNVHGSSPRPIPPITHSNVNQNAFKH